MANEKKLSVVEAQAVAEQVTTPRRSFIEIIREYSLVAYWQEASCPHRRRFLCLLLHSGGERPIRQRGDGSVSPRKLETR